MNMLERKRVPEFLVRYRRNYVLNNLTFRTFDEI